MTRRVGDNVIDPPHLSPCRASIRPSTWPPCSTSQSRGRDPPCSAGPSRAFRTTVTMTSPWCAPSCLKRRADHPNRPKSARAGAMERLESSSPAKTLGPDLTRMKSSAPTVGLGLLFVTLSLVRTPDTRGREGHLRAASLWIVGMSTRRLFAPHRAFCGRFRPLSCTSLRFRTTAV